VISQAGEGGTHGTPQGAAHGTEAASPAPLVGIWLFVTGDSEPASALSIRVPGDQIALQGLHNEVEANAKDGCDSQRGV
jgi:hypothetical protein